MKKVLAETSDGWESISLNPPTAMNWIGPGSGGEMADRVNKGMTNWLEVMKKEKKERRKAQVKKKLKRR